MIEHLNFTNSLAANWRALPDKNMSLASVHAMWRQCHVIENPRGVWPALLLGNGEGGMMALCVGLMCVRRHDQPHPGRRGAGRTVKPLAQQHRTG